MQILIIRHARAGERSDFAQTGQPDSQRPLTDDGIRRMRKGVKGLRTLVPKLDVLAASPYVRTMQTADIVSEGYGTQVTALSSLEPGGELSELFAWLNQLDVETVALVGHEPDLGHLIGEMLAGGEHYFLPMKKGAVCSIRFFGPVTSGRGELEWAMRCVHLRQIGRAS